MIETKIVSISDIHGNLLKNIPAGDILTISGDICPTLDHSVSFQRKWILTRFIPWCNSLVENNIVKHIVFVAGNHDFIFEHANMDIDFPSHIHYLHDTQETIEGIKFYGTPWTPQFYDWAFMDSEKKLAEIFENIPEGLDVLLTHGPAYGYCDRVVGESEYLGSKALKEAIRRAKPRWVLSGHIHTGSHKPVHPSEAVSCVDVSVLDENYMISFPPFEFTLIKD